MRPDTKKNIFIAAVYAAVLALGIFLGQNFSDENLPIGNTSIIPLGLADKTSKVQNVLQIVEGRYVDKVAMDTLQDYAITEILQHLDPHSTYLSPRKVQSINESLQGSFDGIGIEYYLINDTLLVTNLVPEGPADKAGIKRGDRIVWVNDVQVSGVKITKQKISELVRGKRGTTVSLWVHRAGKPVETPIQIIRNKIKVSSIDAAYLIGPNVGYIKIHRFGAQTAMEFRQALEGLLDQRANKLILDLRDNTGGYFFAALEVADEFFGADQLLVYTKGANEAKTDYYASTGGLFESQPLIVLVNEQSASASEIVAGAVQDLDRGLVIGRRSFGKGLVQEQFDFGDGSAMNLTIARYYTPSGRSIQKPYNQGHISYFNEINQRYADGELTSGKVNSADTVSSDGQVFHTGSGRAIMAEGGIMPDIYIPLDTTMITDFYRSVIKRGLINRYVYHELIGSPPAFSIEKYMEDYRLPGNTYNNFITAVRPDLGRISWQQQRASANLIESDMRAILAKFYFGDEAWFRIKNSDDRIIQRAIEELESDNQEN